MKGTLIAGMALLGVWWQFDAVGQVSPPDTNTVPVSKNPAAALKLFESWKGPVPPARIVGNVYYVGFSGVSSFLITTPEGHILIDTCFQETVPKVCSNIEALGFRVRDVRWLLSSHAHADHVGGHATMKQLTGARIAASAADAHLLETGGDDDFSPFPKGLMRYMPVKADRIVTNGETLSLGDVTLTATLTPGHTKGATTWTMTVKEGDRSYAVVFFSSVSIVTPTRLVNNSDYPSIAEDYAVTFERLKALPCDIFLAPHSEQFGLAEKLKRVGQGVKENPFVDSQGWRRLIENAERTYLRQLESEKAGR